MGRAFEYRKQRKFARWGKMARTFTRLGKEIVIAAKAGGPHPESNPRLRAIIQNAKAENMPKDNIDRAIKRAISIDQADYKEVILEGYAPHGVALLIETATDNNTRTVGNVRSYFNKFNGSLGTQGSVEFMFEHKCFFRIKNNDYDLEELELELIDDGSDEIYAEEDGVMIWAPFSAYGTLQATLEGKGYEVLSSGFDRIPQDVKELTPEQQADVDKLLERLDDDDDVQNVYHNMA